MWVLTRRPPTIWAPCCRDLPSPPLAWGLSPMDPFAQRGQGSLRAPCAGCAPALEATLAPCPCQPWPAPSLLQHPFSKALRVPLEAGRWGLDCGRKCGGNEHQGQGSREGSGSSEGASRCKCVHGEGTQRGSSLAPGWLHRTRLLLGSAGTCQISCILVGSGLTYVFRAGDAGQGLWPWIWC